MNENELYHHGTKGQKWGIRKYQNSDGSLTPAGKERYGKNVARKIYRINKLQRKQENARSLKSYKKFDKQIRKLNTKKERMESGLTKSDIERGRHAIANFRTKRLAVSSIAKAGATAAGIAWLATNPVGQIQLAVGASAAMIGAVSTLNSASKIPYYARESKSFKSSGVKQK